MYIEQTEIKNFKGIAEMSLEFAPGINLLIGNNGVGKRCNKKGNYFQRSAF